jgi:hypothetical protein
MNSAQQLDILLYVCLDHQLVQTIRIDPALLQEPCPSNAVAENAVSKDRSPDQSNQKSTSYPMQRSTIYLPPSGRVRLKLDLRRTNADQWISVAGRMTLVYDSSEERYSAPSGNVESYFHQPTFEYQKFLPMDPLDDPPTVH